MVVLVMVAAGPGQRRPDSDGMDDAAGQRDGGEEDEQEAFHGVLRV
jgi:hypothetical protein